MKNGQKSVGKKPTVLELEQRITEVEMLLSLGARRTQIHAAIGQKYPNPQTGEPLDWRTVDRYVSRARENLAKRTGKSKEEHKDDSFNFYEAIALNANAKASDRIRARQRIDELLGLDAPKHIKTEVRAPDGVKVALEAKVKQEIDFNIIATELSSIATLLGGNGNGEPVHRPDADPEASRLSPANGH